MKPAYYYFFLSYSFSFSFFLPTPDDCHFVYVCVCVCVCVYVQTYMGKTARNYMENEEEADSEKTHYYALRGSGRSNSAAVCGSVHA